jgi:hypothetical protein
MRPFFSYYGGKWRAAPKYPAPAHDTIVEPFAGSAGYAVRHHGRKVRLYDIDPIICGVWDYLIRVGAEEVRSLPLAFDTVDDLAVCQEAKWLIGFWINKGVASPRKRPAAWIRQGIRPNSTWGEAVRGRIASQVDLIRHWTIAECSYEQIPNLTATWFVDPPYQGKCGRHYRFHRVDFAALGRWCRGREGQAIVCEQAGADWLPFRSLGAVKGTLGPTHEMIWTNEAAALAA